MLELPSGGTSPSYAVGFGSISPVLALEPRLQRRPSGSVEVLQLSTRSLRSPGCFSDFVLQLALSRSSAFASENYLLKYSKLGDWGGIRHQAAV